jgi:hypothetical protein
MAQEQAGRLLVFAARFGQLFRQKSPLGARPGPNVPNLLVVGNHGRISPFRLRPAPSREILNRRRGHAPSQNGALRLGET